MNPVRPVLPGTEPDSRLRALNVGETQAEYGTLPAIVFQSDQGVATLSRWEFTDEERARIANGECLFLEVLGGMVPVNLYVATPQEVIDYLNRPPDEMPQVVAESVS
jgi:hypothetical protein